jgi:hypothetical protein
MGCIRIGLALASIIGVALTAGGLPAHAAPSAAEDGADTFNVATGTLVKIKNSGDVTFNPGTNYVITCTKSTFSGSTGTTLKFTVTPPVFSDGTTSCTDSLGAEDAFSGNTTNGAWVLKEKDFGNAGAGDEGQVEPNPKGDKLALTIPKAGLVLQSSLGCFYTLAPSGAVSVTGKYDDGGVWLVRNASIPAAYNSDCPAPMSRLTLSVTYTLNPALFDIG